MRIGKATMRRTGIWLATALLLAACSGKPGPRPSAGVDTDLDPSGRPYVGPPGTLASTPPADTNVDRLYCRQEGPGRVCSRNP